MAKRARSSASPPNGEVDNGSTASTTEERLGDFAEDLGRFLGSTQAKASAWLEQRKKLLDNLVKVRDTATHYIEQLGGTAAQPRRGRPRANQSVEAAPAPKRRGAKKKRTMSAEARAKIAAAQRARWARQRKGRDQ
jgi:hypothetical protein